MDRADSFIVDPHKWLFATGGSCALVYREPALARQVHTQHGPYIDVLRTDDDAYNPCDLGYQLTRRASGLPIWFALALHGVDAHRDAIRRGIRLAAAMADGARRPSVDRTDHAAGARRGAVPPRRLGTRASGRRGRPICCDSGTAFVAPSTYKGEPVGRLVFMHPRTPDSIIDELMLSLSA